MPQSSKKLQVTSYNSQKGNVFIIILIAIFLFGALMFTFSRSGSQGVSSISKQEAKIAAQEILNYARLVEGAVDRVRRNGCSESEISFENSTVAGYINANSPVDNSCHVFDDAGGKISFLDNASKHLDINKTASANYGNILFIGKLPVSNIASNKEELLLMLSYIDKNICLKINSILNATSPSSDAPEEGSSFNNGQKFTGGYGLPSTGITNVINTYGGCIKSTLSPTPGTYHFYYILLAR